MFQEWFKDYERIIKEGREAMTKEQEEAIEIVAKYLNFNEICGTRNFKEAIETLLSMLKEKDKEIEKYKYLYQKALDNTIEADRENIQLKKQIDLMAEFIEKITVDLKVAFGENMLWNRDDIKQYFERKEE